LIEALGRTGNAIKNRLKTLGIRRDPAFVKQLLKTQCGRSGEENANWKGGISQNHYHYKKIQWQRYPEKIRAREAVKKAIKSGKLEKGVCVFCGSEDVQGHHEDYSKPLEVTWLCLKHHRKVDAGKLALPSPEEIKASRGKQRPLTIPVKKITKTSLQLGQLAYPEQHRRPRNRRECKNVPRPCPFVGCRYNLFLDIDEESGSIKFNFPWMDPLDMEESCVLDLVSKGRLTLEVTGRMMNITRERIRQIEERLFGELSENEEIKELVKEILE